MYTVIYTVGNKCPVVLLKVKSNIPFEGHLVFLVSDIENVLKYRYDRIKLSVLSKVDKTGLSVGLSLEVCPLISEKRCGKQENCREADNRPTGHFNLRS